MAEELVQYAALSPAELNKKVKQLEQKMYQRAQNLEFEEAVRVRDEIKRIQEAGMGLAEGGVV